MSQRPPWPVLLLLGPPALLYHLLAVASPKFAFAVVYRLLYWAAGLDMRMRAWHLGKGPLSQYDVHHLLNEFYGGFFGKYQDVAIFRQFGQVESRLYNCVFLRAMAWWGVVELAQAFCRADADFWHRRGVEQRKWTLTKDDVVECRSLWTFETPNQEKNHV